MPKILVFYSDEYIGRLEECDLIIMPENTPDEVLDDCYEGASLCEKLTDRQIPHIEGTLRYSGGKIREVILKTLMQSPEATREGVAIKETLTNIEKV